MEVTCTAPLLGSQIATPNIKIHELNEERATLIQTYVQSPIVSRIPPSVLSHIFWLAVCPYDPEGDIRHPRLSDNKGLFNFRSVCSHWRRVTQSSPHLWSMLALAPKTSLARTRATDYVALVKHYCLNATVISVYISDLRALGRTTVDEIMRVLLEEYPRKLESLFFLRDPDGLLCHSTLKYAKEDVEFPNLKELQLACRRVETQPQGAPAFCNSPRLRTLILVAGKDQHIPFEFPRGQVTTLKLYEASPEYTFQLLSRCPNLTECRISYHDGDDNLPLTPRQDPTISMQFVRELTWFSLGIDEDALYSPPPQPVDPQFFAHFRFPAVRKLEWDAPLPSDAPFIRDFFASMQEVEELKLWASQSDYCLGQHLDIFRNLTTLDLYIATDPFYDFGDDSPSRWLYRLTVRKGGDNLFPQLQKLSLIVGDVAPHGLIVLLYSRRNGPVDWSDYEQGSENLILPPYDPTSTHWQHHTRLVEFSSKPYDDGISIDWTWSPHYDGMRAMMEEAEEVEGFGDYETGLNRILF